MKIVNLLLGLADYLGNELDLFLLQVRALLAENSFYFLFGVRQKAYHEAYVPRLHDRDLGQFFCQGTANIAPPIPAGVGSQHTLVAGAVDNALNSATATTAFELCKIDSASITPVCDAAGCRLDFDVGVRWAGLPGENVLCPVTSISDPLRPQIPSSYPKIIIYGSDVPLSNP